MKKGFELTMNAIVIAAICLLILIVLMAIFGGRMGKSVKIIDNSELDCADGCQPKVECGSGEKQAFGNFKVHKEGKVCCCPT